MDDPHRDQLIRFVINGLVAACTHFLVLSASLKSGWPPSAAACNMVGSVAGITASFIGNRYFVFRVVGPSIWLQLTRFWMLYAILTLMHGAVMLLWTDVGGFDYRAGFVLGAIVQAVCTFYGGREWVFKP